MVEHGRVYGMAGAHSFRAFRSKIHSLNLALIETFELVL